MRTLAKDRRHTTLVQSISLLRQKKLDETVKSLNNLLACDRALPADRAVSWDERSELQDLFSTYVSREQNGEKQAAVAKTLGISDSEADSLRQVVSSGSWKLEEEAADSGKFF
jgi:hypothetical protein